MAIPQDQFDQIVDAVVEKLMVEIRKELASFKREILTDISEATEIPLTVSSDPVARSPQRKFSFKNWW